MDTPKLSITGSRDYQVMTPLSILIKTMYFLSKFGNLSPSVTEDMKICQSCDYQLRRHYILRWSALWNPFKEVIVLLKFEFVTPLINWRYKCSQTGHFSDFEQVKNEVSLVTLSSSRMTVISLIFGSSRMVVILLSLDGFNNIYDIT